MQMIPLTREQVALIDDEDYERVNAFKWHVRPDPKMSLHKWYAMRWEYLRGGKGKRRRVHLHRFIMDAPAGVEVDHVNGNPLDCRRENMRLATRSQNASNRTLQSNNTSGFRGIHKSGARFIAQIKVNGKQKRLGSFSTAEDAARRYDHEAIAVRGDFVRLNFRLK